MLKTNYERLARSAETREHTAREAQPRDGVPLRLSSLARHKALIAICCTIFLLLGVVYLALRPPTYVAVSQLLIDHQVLQRSQQDAMFATSAMDATVVQNQVAILSSQMIALRVVDALNLANDPDFQRGSPGVVARLMNGVGNAMMGIAAVLPGDNAWLADPAERLTIDTSIEPTVAARRQVAGEIVQRNIDVRRIGGSHLIEVLYSAPDPEQAAQITNEIVRLYLEDQAAANARAAQSASSWLRERISALGTSARVVSEAWPPSRPSGPGALSILTASLVAGLLLGTAGAWLRDAFDRNVRRPADAAALVQADFIGAATFLRSKPRAIHDDGLHAIDGATGRIVSRSLSSFYWALENPRSRFAHTLRRALIAAEDARSQGLGSIGITSTLPGEGRTVTAANLASLAASLGKRVLLIDADVYKPDLSRAYGLQESVGLRDVLAEKTQLSDAVWTDFRSGAHILPLGGSETAARANGEIWNGKMERLLQEAYATYDCVVVDLPPLTPVADVRAAGEMIGSLVMVIEWSKIPADDIQNGLASSGPAQARILGAMFNKVRPRNLAEADIVGPKWRSGMRHYVDDGQSLHPLLGRGIGRRAEDGAKQTAEPADGRKDGDPPKDGKKSGNRDGALTT
jgi:polysaccharide biosynthesis transport protein